MTAVRLSLVAAAAALAAAPARPAPPAVTALAYSPDGGLLAVGTHGQVVLIDPKTGDDDRVIRVWTVGQAAPRLTLTDHSDAVYAVAFSPDGKLLASGSADRAVKVWD